MSRERDRVQPHRMLPSLMTLVIELTRRAASQRSSLNVAADVLADASTMPTAVAQAASCLAA